MAEKLEFNLAVQNNQLGKALDDSAKKASSLEGALETAIGVLGGGLALKAFDSLISGFNSLISVGKEAIDAAAGQETATNNLNNALARAGNFSKQASKDILDYASAVQQTTVFEDDAVIANTALLQSLTKLNTEGLKQGVSAAADFATVLGIDLETATRLVAKAAEGNTEAFKRYGVEIKKGSSDTESFANTIQALNSQFGGASSAQLNTYSGSLKALNNAYGDLLEPIGDIIVKNPIVIALFNEIKKSINEANTEVTGLVPTMQELVKDGFIAASVAAGVLLDVFGVIAGAVQVLVGVFQNLSGLIGQTLIAPFELVIDSVIFLGSKIPVLGKAFEDLVNPLDGATKSMSDLAQNGVDKVATAFDGNVFTEGKKRLEEFTTGVLDTSYAVSLAAQNAVKNGEDRRTSENEVNADILKSRIDSGNALLAAQAQLAIEESTFKANQDILNLESQDAKDAAAIQRIYDRAIAEADAVYQAELLKNKVIEDQQTKLALNLAAADNLAKSKLKAEGDFKISEAKRVADQESRLNKERIANQSDTFATIATLSSSNNKTLATIGKAAALTQIAIDGPQAVTKALAAFPPPFNFAAAAAVGTAVAAQAARVVGVQFENGGIVGQQGASVGGDNRIASVRDGEMILNASQQQKLLGIIDSGGGGGTINLVVDGRVLASVIRDQVQSGFRLT